MRILCKRYAPSLFIQYVYVIGINSYMHVDLKYILKIMLGFEDKNLYSCGLLNTFTVIFLVVKFLTNSNL